MQLHLKEWLHFLKMKICKSLAKHITKFCLFFDQLVVVGHTILDVEAWLSTSKISYWILNLCALNANKQDVVYTIRHSKYPSWTSTPQRRRVDPRNVRALRHKEKSVDFLQAKAVARSKKIQWGRFFIFIMTRTYIETIYSPTK